MQRIMIYFVILTVAIGVVASTPVGFLQNTPEVQYATENFIREYNRLAKLAADAPDIDIYGDDNLQRIDNPHAVRTGPVVNPLQGVTVYSYAANLGQNAQFQPSQFSSFSQPQAPVQRRNVQHRFQQQPAVQRTHHVQNIVHHQPQRTHTPIQFSPIQSTPVQRWQGPFAHTVPAGVNGPPQQAVDTAEVQAAKNAHFAILNAAFQRAAEQARQVARTESNFQQRRF